MKAYDLADLAAHNLRESILRNSLTTLGIAVGVSSLVAMLSLGIGLQQLATRRLKKTGLFDTVVVTSRHDLRSFSREQENTGPAPALEESARQKIAQTPGVLEAFPDIRFISELRYEDKPHLILIAGLPLSAKERDAFESMSGGFFSSETAPEVILQKSLAEELLGRKRKAGEDDSKVAELAPPLLGKQLTMQYAERVPTEAGSASTSSSERDIQATSEPTTTVPGAAYSVFSRRLTLKIVGISDLDPDSLRGPGRARCFIPLKLAENLHVMQPNLRDSTSGIGNTPIYASLSVRARSLKDIPTVENAIKKMGFNTFSIVDATRSMRQFFAVLDLFLGIFGSLALAVASIGIVNTLVMAILERRREIGIMKAIGASDVDVKKLFFTEAGAMGGMGGMVGVALGWAIGRVINMGANIYLRRQELPPEQIWFVPWWLVVGAIAFAILVSLVSGLYPASRAARLDPVQGLRYE